MGAHSDEHAPVWSFHRFGRTATRLPDGRWVLVAGEHEDHYDPDFYIYNDATVIGPNGQIDHFIYPTEIFPPTDFHTATLLGDQILLVGNLGYHGQRPDGITQVLRLDLGDFSISRVETGGDNPGWISHHTAQRIGNILQIERGKVEPGYVHNTDIWELNLNTWIWSQC